MVKTGWLVYSGIYGNKSLIEDMVLRQKSALERARVPFEYLRLDEAAERISNIMLGKEEAPAWALYRAADMEMKMSLELLGTKVVNSYEVAKICQDKFLTAVFCAAHDIKHPRTIRVPNMEKFAALKDDFIESAERVVGYPMLVKDAQGEQGKGLIIANNREELTAALTSDGAPLQIVQELITTSWGKDARLFVVDGKVSHAMQRVNETGDFRSGTESGGVLSAYTPTADEAAFGEYVGSFLPGSSVSVDIMWDADGSPILCEMNGNPNFGSFIPHGSLYNAPIADDIAKMIKRIASE